MCPVRGSWERRASDVRNPDTLMHAVHAGSQLLECKMEL